jgi:hypothetical protein
MCASERPRVALAKTAKTNALHSIATVSPSLGTIRLGLTKTFAQLLAIKNAALKMRCVLTIAAMNSVSALKFSDLIR